MATAPVTAVSNDDVTKFVQTNFPTYAWALQIPDLFKTFKEAIGPNGSQGISSDQLVSKLEATPWWQSHGTSVRQYMNLQFTDPDSLAEQMQAKDADVHQMANKLGLADNQVNIDQMARNAIMYGWNDAELQEQLSSQAQFNPSAPSTSNIGTIDDTMAQLKQNAANYMVSIDDQTAFGWARDVAAGHHTVDDYTPILSDWAKGRFPSLASYIDQGITPKQYFQPQQQEVGRLLEVGADSIDLANDPKFSKIVNYSDPKTGAPRPMTLAETQSYVRSMDQWKQTKQAQQSAADMTQGLLQMFGKVSTGSSTSGIAGPSNAF